MKLTLKQYIYIGIAILIIGLTVWGNYNRQQYLKAKAASERLAHNQDQLMDQVNQYMRLDADSKRDAGKHDNRTG